MIQDDDDTRVIVYRWFSRAQIEYSDLYMRLFISYNAWFRKVTGASSDREAIRCLKMRFVIWSEYTNGTVLKDMRRYVDLIACETALRPLKSGVEWNGTVKDTDDWKGLISFWYRVRCDLFHGSLSTDNDIDQELVYLAYRSLNCFMTEIISRMQECFTNGDMAVLEQITKREASQVGRTHDEAKYQNEMFMKFMATPTIWSVDMTPYDR